MAFLLTRVDETITARDAAAIETLGVTGECRSARGNFDAEVACFKRLQARLAEKIPSLRCLHRWGAVSHEPADVLARGHGCCYSRSRVIEKALRVAGYQVRHVALYQRSSSFALLDVVLPQNSHSTTEVLSSKGWLLVDSNHPFVPVSADGEPLTAREVSERRAERGGEPLPKSLLGGNYFVVYGLYSRHGGFYRPFAPIPDLAWRDLKYNFAD